MMRKDFDEKATQALTARDKTVLGAIIVAPALALGIYLAANNQGAEIMRDLSCWSPIKGFNGETLCNTTGSWNTGKNPTTVPTFIK